MSGAVVPLGIADELIEVVAEHPRPGDVHRTPRQNRRAIAGAGLLVQLVGELVQHDVVAVVNVGGAGDHTVPGQDHHVARPRFAKAGLRLVVGPGPSRVRATGRHQIGRRIHQDGDEVRIIVGLAMEEQDAGLRGDRDPNLVGDLEAATSFETLLCEEHLDVSGELLPVPGGTHAT